MATINGDDGDNNLTGSSTPGRSYDDTINGKGGNDRIDGGNGNDILSGGLGDDILIGGIGRDTVTYANAANAVTVDLSRTTAQNTGEGMDTLSGIETVIGSAFGDTLTGWGSGNETLIGGGGDDVLVAGFPGQYDGGTGYDTLRITIGADDLPVNLSSTRYKSIEYVIGSGSADTITGAEAGERLDGGKGGDTLRGMGGDDLLSGGKGSDLIDGGAGSDTVSFAVTAGAIKIDLRKTTVQGTGEGNDVIINVENVTGSAFNDRITGSGLYNRLTGEDGNDTLYGLGGKDTLLGGDGNDILDGGSSNDTLNGGTGSDILTGGTGADTFIIGANSGVDRITDFSTAHDTLRLDHAPVITQAGDDVKVDLGGGNVVTLTGVDSSDADFMSHIVW